MECIIGIGMYIKKSNKNKEKMKRFQLQGEIHKIRINTQQGTNYTATCLPSRKLYKLDEADMQDTAGEARTSS